MKVIFLDIDGVLNSERYVKSCGICGLVIDPKRMELLKKLVNATDAKIVLSTSWRCHWSSMEGQCDKIGLQLNSMFRKYGLEIYDKTPENGYTREQAIEAWLKDCPKAKRFVVLDDKLMDERGFLKNKVVRTADFRNGLEESDVKKAISILNA